MSPAKEYRIAKPCKILVPFPKALAWRAGTHLFQRKYDGKFQAVRLILPGTDPVILACEHVTARSGAFLTAADREILRRRGSFYAVFDLLALDGLDMQMQPLRTRWRELCALAPCFDAAKDGLVLADSGPGGEFVERCLATGGEGVVAKDWESRWGDPMKAAVVLWPYRVRVAGFCAGTQSVRIVFAEGGHKGKDAGHLALRGGKCDRVRIGSLLKVEGKRLTAAGLIREPRLCQDTPISWLVKF